MLNLLDLHIRYILPIIFIGTLLRPFGFLPGVAPDKSYGETQTHVVFLPLISSNTHTNYYIDSISGSDANPGTSSARPWRSLVNVQDTHFTPGSVIHFKRGSVWTGSLLIRDSGQPINPIVFTAYGSGERPVLRNPGDANHRTKGILIDADWVVVEDLLIRDVFHAGIHVLRNSEHNVIKDVEVTQAGFGVLVEGQYNLVTQSEIHDLHMVTNTPGGNDDHGAVGVSIENSFNEISYNRFLNCIASSYDFGKDGGAVEWWGVADGVYVHHNWASGNDGFLEVGGGSARNAVVAYNVSVNNRRFAAIQLSGQFASVVDNFRVENNTIVETPGVEKGWDVFWFSSPPGSNSLILRNNIVYADWFSTIANLPGFTHQHNLYFLGSGTSLNFNLNSGEMIAAPAFVGLAAQDFHLQASSPAVNAGQDLGYSGDFEDKPVPVGLIPDLGAFERQGNP